ncbi:hypothetical protein M0802_016713 [Mischocyttarus mexicanus]|nr:hypothetical protein M0802_016713 [Mischocyttarus mexicanus]
MNVLLHGMIPDDNTENESEWQLNVRKLVNDASNTEDTPQFQESEVENIIKRLGPKKAPGYDLIEADMVKQA